MVNEPGFDVLAKLNTLAASADPTGHGCPPRNRQRVPPGGRYPGARPADRANANQKPTITEGWPPTLDQSRPLPRPRGVHRRAADAGTERERLRAVQRADLKTPWTAAPRSRSIKTSSTTTASPEERQRQTPRREAPRDGAGGGAGHDDHGRPEGKTSSTTARARWSAGPRRQVSTHAAVCLQAACSRKPVLLLTWRSSAQICCELHERAFGRPGGTTTIVVLDNLTVARSI